jgi:hypothetical protein
LEQELLIFQGLPSSPAVFNGIPAARSVVFCVVFLDYCLSYCPFLLAIVLRKKILLWNDNIYIDITELHCNLNTKCIETYAISIAIIIYL